MSAPPRRVLQLALAATTAIASIAFGEVAIKWLMPQNLSIWDNTRDGMTIHWPHADVYLPRYSQRIRINALGMRDAERSIDKEPGTMRTIVLGDSFMEALQVSREQSFPHLLEEQLRASQGSAEVVNLAVSGWGTDDEVTYLERVGLGLSPDRVLIMMTLHNDVNDNSIEEFHALRDRALVARPVEQMPWSRYAIQKVKAFLAGHSQIYQLAYQTWVRTRVREGAKQLDRHVASLLRRDVSPTVGDSWDLTIALLERAQELCSSRGIELAIGLIPLQVQVERAALAGFLEAHELDESDLDLEGPQRRVSAWGRARGVLVVDLLDEFRRASEAGRDDLFVAGDGHWTVAGHALAAGVVAREWPSRHRSARVDPVEGRAKTRP